MVCFFAETVSHTVVNTHYLLVYCAAKAVVSQDLRIAEDLVDQSENF